MRRDSLSGLNLEKWNWQPFFNELYDQLSIFNLESYPVGDDFLYKESQIISQKETSRIITSTWACKMDKIRQVRMACIKGSKSISVMNLVISPFNNYDLPFFGADFVTLPNGHLLALDLQPALKNDRIHTQDVWSRLIPLHSKWQSLLPSGGDIPTEAKSFFSPGFLWTRLPLNAESDKIIMDILMPAFREYLLLYIELMKNAEEVSEQRALKILEGQKCYMQYRSQKDPARGMLSRFYGKEWTEEYIQKVLFNL